MSASAGNVPTVPLPQANGESAIEQRPHNDALDSHGGTHSSAVPRTLPYPFRDAPVVLNAPHDGWTLRDDATYVPAKEYRRSFEATSAGDTSTRNAPGLEGDWPRQHGNAGKAAHLASRQHRPVEVWRPESNTTSAGKAATLAARNHKSVEATVRRAASLSVARSAKDIPRTPERTRVRAMDLSHVQEAASEAAARRLALLDQELAGNAEMRRRNSVGAVSAARSGLRAGGYQKSTSPSRVPSTHINMKPKDYVHLLDVAKRNVNTRMTGIDQEVAMKNGLPYRKDWEEQAMRIVEARKKAEAEGHDLTGKIDLGGGKFVDAEVINAMAARNVQPIIDEVNELAAEARAKQAEEKAELERKKHEKQLLDERHRETQQELKKAKAAEKAEAARIKHEEKLEKKRIQAEEKERQATAARIAETHQNSSRQVPRTASDSDTASLSVTEEPPTTVKNKSSENHKTGGLKGLLHKLRPGKGAAAGTSQADTDNPTDLQTPQVAASPEMFHPQPVRPTGSGPAIDVRSDIASIDNPVERDEVHVPEVILLPSTTELRHPSTRSLVSSPSSSSVERLERTVEADEVSISSGSVGAIDVGEGVTVSVKNPETTSTDRPATPLDEPRVWYDTQDRVNSPGRFDARVDSPSTTTGKREVESRFHEVL